MKQLIVRCEDDADPAGQAETLLQGARVPYLRQLAQAGAAGLIQQGMAGSSDGRLGFHRALFGLRPQEQDAAPGRCYAAGAGLQVGSEETAWCCELVTQRDGRVIDPTAGHIPTQESRVLIQALDEAVGSEAIRWEAGEGSQHVLVTSHETLRAAEPDAVFAPARLDGRAWDRMLPKGALGSELRRLLVRYAGLLTAHPVNRVRVDLGENPANFLWLWGPGRGGAIRTFRERCGRSGAVLSDRFEVKGFARVFGLSWQRAAVSFDVEAMQGLAEDVLRVVEQHDVVEVHLCIRSTDAVERLCAMERIDQVLVKAVTEGLPRFGPWRLLVAVDDRREGTIPLIAIGTGLPQHPVTHLDAQHLAESPLLFQDATALAAWFTDAGGGASPRVDMGA